MALTQHPCWLLSWRSGGGHVALGRPRAAVWAALHQQGGHLRICEHYGLRAQAVVL